jgi:hypothetical protein
VDQKGSNQGANGVSDRGSNPPEPIRITYGFQAVKSLPSHHDLHLGDARDLSMIDDESVDLVVTAPP